MHYTRNELRFRGDCSEDCGMTDITENAQGNTSYTTY